MESSLPQPALVNIRISQIQGFSFFKFLNFSRFGSVLLGSRHRASNLALCKPPIINQAKGKAPPQMPTCVECDAPVATLYTEYSKGNIRLTSCVS